jgi:hypothetical protein
LIGLKGGGQASREDAKDTLATGRGTSDFPASELVSAAYRGVCIAVLRRFEEIAGFFKREGAKLAKKTRKMS